MSQGSELLGLLATVMQAEEQGPGLAGQSRPLPHVPGVLIHGPSGCGKTLFIQAFVNEFKGLTNIETRFMHIEGPDILKSTMEATAMEVKEKFSKSRLYAPTILFLDNLDRYANENCAAVVNQLNLEFANQENKGRLIILGATNRRELVDTTLLAAGRFEKQIHVPLPNLANRVSILKAITRDEKVDNGVNFLDISRRCEGLTGANLKGLVTRAASEAALEGSAVITAQNFETALSNLR